MIKKSDASIHSAMVDLLRQPHLGLDSIALAADVIAADARFNLWVATVAKKEASDRQMESLINVYDGVVLKGVIGLELFEMTGDAKALDESLRATVSELQLLRSFISTP